MKAKSAAVVLGAIFWTPFAFAHGSSATDARSQVVVLVQNIQRDDYEGNRTALKRDFADLAPFVTDPELSAAVRYWRGFALWRRAINGFNETVDTKEQEADLKGAIDEFTQIPETASVYGDARIGMVSCLGYLLYVNGGKDPAGMQALFAQIGPIAKSAKLAAPDNPRLLWVAGPNLWLTPPERGGGQDKAIANYEKGLEIVRKLPQATDPLQPSWGEAELLMSLAWSQLNQTKPDPAAAERNARAALGIVPYWHYVKDILLPQILAAKEKEGGK